jgi:predicted transcriptional regulator
LEPHSRVEVLTRVLLLAKGGATKMRIMDESSLTSPHVEQCLWFLQLSGLLRKKEGDEVFWPTRKGASLIKDYERINQTIEWRLLVSPLTR